METHKISDRLYMETIDRIREISAEHEQKADVYQALVQAYDLIHIQKFKNMKAQTKPIYELLNDLGKKFIDIVTQAESAIEYEKLLYNQKKKIFDEQLMDKLEKEKHLKEVIQQQDAKIQELQEVIANLESKLLVKDEEFNRLKQQGDLLKGVRRLLKNQGIPMTIIDGENKVN